MAHSLVGFGGDGELIGESGNDDDDTLDLDDEDDDDEFPADF